MKRLPSEYTCTETFCGEVIVELKNIRENWNVEGQAKVELDQWNIHDYKNVIAFKDLDAWLRFKCALFGLAKMHHMMNVMDPDHKDSKFTLWFKSYNNEQIKELIVDSGGFINEMNVMPEIEELANKGYIFMFFTTQRECHDKNHFFGYMLNNWLYDKGMQGHVGCGWSYEQTEENKFGPIEFVVINEKW